MDLAVRASTTLSGGALLIPSSVDGVPTVFGLSLAESRVHGDPDPATRSALSYDRTIKATLIGFLHGYLRDESRINISVRVLSGGIVTDYSPTTSYAPTTLNPATGIRLVANFTGMYLDRSDFSRGIAAWSIEIHPCRNSHAETIPTYASIGVTAEPVKIVIEINTSKEQLSLTITKP